MSPATPATPLPARLPYLAFALFVLGCHWLLMAYYGDTMPHWDQWSAEGNALLLPYATRHWHWSALLAAQNEHHIIPTKLLELLLLVVNNGIWNSLLEMVVNALLLSAALTLLMARLNRLLPPRLHRPMLAVAGLILSLPYAWENTLCGFQSQFYFLILFGLEFLWAVACLPMFSRRWWLGMACGALAAVSLASGLVCLVAGALILLLRAAQGSERRAANVVVALAFLLCALPAYLWIPAPTEVISLPPTPAEAYKYLIAILSWPYDAWSALVDLALLILFGYYLIVRPSEHMAARALVPLAMLFLIARLALPNMVPDSAVVLLLPITYFVFWLLAGATGGDRVKLPVLACLWLLITMDWALLAPGAAFIIYLPVWLYGLARLGKPMPERDSQWFGLALALWLLGQYLCISDGRSFGYRSPRYEDLYLIGLVLNFLLLLRWLAGLGTPLSLKNGMVPLLWSLSLVLGVYSSFGGTLTDLEKWRHTSFVQAGNVAAYVQTGNPLYMHKKPGDELPFPVAADLKSYLDTPALRAMLPAELNPANAGRQPALVSAFLGQLTGIAWGVLGLAGVLALWSRRRVG